MKKVVTAVTLLFFAASVFAQLEWMQMPDFPGAGMHGVAAFAINNKGYMGMGIDSNRLHHVDWYEYDPVTNLWTRKADFPGTGRSYSVNFVINGKGYVATGEFDSGRLNDLWEYNPATDSWTQKANFPGTGRQGATGFTIGNKGYLGTGFIGNTTVSKDFYEYDPATDTWTAKADFAGTERNGAAGFGANDKGYISCGSGVNASRYFNDTYEYDTTNDSWSRKADFPLPYLSNANTYSTPTAGYVLCGFFYQFTGITYNPMNMFYKYDATVDTWTLEGTFPGLPRGTAGGFALNTDIYIGSGGQANIPADGLNCHDFWKLSGGLALSVGPGVDNTGFKLFPNPANNIIFIDATLASKMNALRIYDVRGRLISNRYLKNGLESIDISTLAPGAYLVEGITADGKVINSRFIKD